MRRRCPEASTARPPRVESALTINGGVVGLAAGDFTRALGTGRDRCNGPGAAASPLMARIATSTWAGRSATVTSNSGSFVPTGSTLILGAADATHTVTFQNRSRCRAARTVQVDNGAAAVDAILSGALTGVGSRA